MCYLIHRGAEESDVVIHGATLDGAGIGFKVGYDRYKKEQEWKRNEFLNDRITEFQSDPKVFVVQKILDYIYVTVELHPSKPQFEERFVRVGPELLQNTLIHHTRKSERPSKGLEIPAGTTEEQLKRIQSSFTEDEVAIRDCFNRFFFYLDQVEQHLDPGLYETKYLTGIMQYYVDLIARTEYNGKPANAYAALRQYAADYANSATKELLGCFKCQLPSPTMG